MNIIGIVGWKDTGKTTLIERVIVEFNLRNVSVSTVKHAHHNFDLDKKGTDSFRHFNAGSRETILASEMKWVKFSRQENDIKINTDFLIKQLKPVDIIIVEGFKTSSHTKIEVLNNANKKKPLFENDKTIAGLIYDKKKVLNTTLPQFERDNIKEICDFIEKILGVVKK